MAKKGRLIDKEFLMAMATLIGTAIGAGIFGLPYVIAKAGFLPSMALMFLLGVMMLVTNLMYGEIILRSKKRCRLVGCAKRYLGGTGKQLASFASFLSFYSGNLVYIILSGIFLNSLLSPSLGGDEFLYSTLTFVFIFIVTRFDFKIFSLVESWMVLLLVVIVGVVSFKSAPYIDTGNYMTSDFTQFFLPFGVILFSLGASSAVPEIISIISKRKNRIKKVLTWGTILYTLIYVIFIAAIVGVTGDLTSEESFVGLSHFIGDGVIVAGFFLGFLATITSYLVSNVALKEIFQYDYRMKEDSSWFLASIVPYLLFLIGYRDFIRVITFTGSVTGGLVGILIILIFYNAKEKGDRRPEYEINISKGMSFLMILVYLSGIIYGIIYNS